eukprot:2475513-Rhodomonas_salina.1
MPQTPGDHRCPPRDQCVAGPDPSLSQAESRHTATCVERAWRPGVADAYGGGDAWWGCHC